MRQTQDLIINKNRAFFREYKHIFPHGERIKLEQPGRIIGPVPTEKGFLLTLNWPEPVKKDVVGGIRLKDDKGFITIEEVYLNQGDGNYELYNHTYRYISEEYDYLINFKPTQKCSDPLNYYFHYDLDPAHNDQGLLSHLQVLHSHPRFPTERMNLVAFLKVVEMTCYGSGTRAYTTPFYSNHMR